MKEQIEAVKEFHRTYGCLISDKPNLDIDLKTLDMRRDILQEEINELQYAVYGGDIEETLDALADVLYIVLGTAIACGLDGYLEAAFAEVHRSNMSKLGADGKPIFRADGKVLKGPNYSPPNLAAVLGLEDEACS